MSGRVFLVGAGASVAPPANLPAFPLLRSGLISALGLGDIDSAARRLAPERFMQSLQDGGLPLDAWLTETLGQGSPNANHYALREALAKGDTVWTVNIDELVERCPGSPLITWAYGDAMPTPKARLLKPHGTVSGGRFIFTSEQVIRPLSQAWLDRLIDDVRGRDMVVFGYAAGDWDLRPALQQALAAARHVTWFITTEDKGSVIERFPILSDARLVDFMGGSTVDTLTPAFLKWAAGESLTRNTPHELLELATHPADTVNLPKLQGDSRLARALILERCGQTRRAVWSFGRTLLTGSVNSRKLAMRRLGAIAMYSDAPPARPLQILVDKIGYWLFPRRLRVQLDRVAVTRLSSHLGDHARALKRADKATDTRDPAILAARAKAARFAGNYESASRLASQALAESTRRGDADSLAHAVYEQGFTATWMGDYAAASEYVGKLVAGCDGLAGIRWVAWGLWQMACLHLYADDAKQALSELADATSLFRTDGLDQGIVSCFIVSATAHRMLGDSRRFNAALNEGQSLRGSRGWSSYTDSALAVELGEHYRFHGKLDEASAQYQRVLTIIPEEPVQRCVAYLGLGEIAVARGIDATPQLDALDALLAVHPISYAAAHLAILRYRLGVYSQQEALSRIREVAPHLRGRRGKPSASPEGYCLGPKPQIHSLYMA